VYTWPANRDGLEWRPHAAPDRTAAINVRRRQVLLSRPSVTAADVSVPRAARRRVSLTPPRRRTVYDKIPYDKTPPGRVNVVQGRPSPKAMTQHSDSLPSPSLPFPLSFLSSPSSFPFHSSHIPPLLVKVGPLQIQLGGLGEHCELPQRDMGRSLSRNRIVCILALNTTSDGNNFNYFPENQLTKFKLYNTCLFIKCYPQLPYFYPGISVMHFASPEVPLDAVDVVQYFTVLRATL